jgi:hypothetical protein
MRFAATLIICRLCHFVLASLLAGSVGAAEPLRFNRDIRPILTNYCYSCHGPDSNTRAADLRLDLPEKAVSKSESGATAVVPGKPAESELVRRIFSDDATEVMPPPESNKSLNAAQKEMLRQWVAEGATYEPHWSFIRPQRPALPAVSQRDWPRNEIDFFILQRLEKAGLQPSPQTDKTTLIRRLSLDLTGLPPSSSDVDAFVSELTAAENEETTPRGVSSAMEQTYARWVDRYLASPHYGERMAVDWLDAARYADTNGYQVDRDREIYAWRDWVIDAFNANQPFDQFTIEQLAGDLLPNATLKQKIATGFHRNHMLNEEGGVIPEEFLAEYCADRVETTATVWLGQTFLCARCHDHKFDPITQRDFYSLYAFYHNVTETGLGTYFASIRRNAPPMIKLPSPELEAKIVSLKADQTAARQKLAAVESQSANAEHKQLTDRIAQLTKQIDEADLQIPTTLVMEEMRTPRVTKVLIRGVYDQHGDTVTANTPASLPAMSPDLPKNRLGLAQWLMDPVNPLTARVTVNRLWQSLFGAGLVRTTEDFGTQGEPPSHPELLDWLADEFVRSGWDVKATMRLMVTSATYRQSSRFTQQLLERDPDNRLLARGPRFRLQAEFLRDQALAASGLLVNRIGGSSVKPYHPPGLYEQVSTGPKYIEGTGDDLFRRSMYTYWKRSVPHPAMYVFDAPFRETCTVRRTRTNTPLQALNLMNDPTYLEAARFLAERMLLDGGPTRDSQIAHGFSLVLARPPRPAEVAVLAAAYDRSKQDFHQDPTSLAELLKTGSRKSSTTVDQSQLAALTIVASTILNLDETVMKE